MTEILPQRYTVTVSRVVPLSPTTKLFRLSFPPGVRFLFTAGQFVSLVRVTEEGELRRSYSIASRPSITDSVELLIRKKEDGALTPWLHELREGMMLLLRGPYGRFRIHDRATSLVFIAAGAGVSPFRGMIGDYLERGGKRSILLLFGFRTPQDFFFREEFEDLARRYPHFCLIPTASQPSDDWDGGRGRVTEILEEHIADPEGKSVYICGPPAMVDETLRTLKSLGFSDRQFFVERWSS